MAQTENEYAERALELFHSGRNCAQAVLTALAPACGISEETAEKIAVHFGGGMKMASVCGAITGGLMAIGLLGGGDDACRAFMNAIWETHDGMVNCGDLLRVNSQKGLPRNVLCDGMVRQATESVTQIMHLV